MEYPAWIEPHPGHKLYKNASGGLAHTSGFPCFRDRVSKKVTVLVQDAHDEKIALSPPLSGPEKDALLEVVGDGSGTVPVSFDDLVTNLSRITTQCPGLFGPAIEELSAKIQEVGSLEAFAQSLTAKIRDLEAHSKEWVKKHDAHDQELKEYAAKCKAKAEAEAKTILDQANAQARQVVDQARASKRIVDQQANELGALVVTKGKQLEEMDARLDTARKALDEIRSAHDALKAKFA